MFKNSAVTEIFLLGAGASKEAKMPNAFELFEVVEEGLGENQKREFQDLGNRFTQIRESNIPFTFEELFGFLEDELRSSRKNAVLEQLKSAIVKILVKTLWLREYESERLNYFEPLCIYVQHKPAHVATLNWDNVFETTFRKLFPPLDLDEGLVLKNSLIPSPGRKFFPGFQDDNQNLKFLKLHGSADLKHGTEWNYDKNMEEGFWIKSIGFDYVQADIVLGVGKEQRIKEEPYLWSLFQKFSDLLSVCNKLHVVGYSFSDDHINELLIDRLLKNAKPLEIVVASGGSVSIPQEIEKFTTDTGRYASTHFSSLLEDIDFRSARM
ncbi:MAG: SIR2 family protein [Cyanobacteria bacterium TGS_CYA1]|nr:SIR2 family protein [Cyanobacteria bacterium TGS_CYA1]